MTPEEESTSVKAKEQWTWLLFNTCFDKMIYVSSTVERAGCMLRWIGESRS